MMEKGNFLDNLVQVIINSRLLQILLGLVVVIVANGIYRLHFSPLSGIPGPRLAALTGWYEIYYDLVKDGQWMKKLESMHLQYGPIVRISPREVHIQDADFSQKLYNSRYAKDPVWLATLGQGFESTASTIDHSVHARRRSAIDPFFSRAGISARSEIISNLIDRMVDRVAEAHRTQATICADDLYIAMTLDIITLFCYGKSYDYLDRENLGAEWRSMMRDVFGTTRTFKAFPIVGWILSKVPPAIAFRMDPKLKSFLALLKGCEEQIRLSLSKGIDSKQCVPDNIFSHIVESNLPEMDKKMSRLIPEGVGIVVAGSDTTAKALTVTTFYLLRAPDIIDKLRQEIKSVNGRIEWPHIEKLPWLSAVILEGTRLLGSLSSRSPRITNQDIHYRGFVIPNGTVVSQTTYLMLMDPATYPEPSVFRPARWLTQKVDGTWEVNKKMSGNMIAWSKGSRSCVGMWLAQAEMYLTIAKLIGRFDLELVDTTTEDVIMASDRFLPYPKADSKGARFKVVKDAGPGNVIDFKG